MKTAQITRERIVQLKSHFSDASMVTPMPEGTFREPCPHCGKDVDMTRAAEPMGRVQTFKWRAARNAEHCKQVAQSFRPDIERIMADTPELQEFFFEQEELFTRFQKKDAEGKPVPANPDGSIPVDDTRADEIKAAMVELKQKHSQAMRDHENRDANLKAYMAQTVEIELMTVDVDNLPRKISGDWMLAIAEMLENVPTEVGG
jgi:hypothetical protein